MDLLNDLNESQRKAVEYIDGPSLVIAGAGSGKTRVLTYKIAYLLQQGVKPWNIMALTFTNKAAREMKERIGKLVGQDLAQHLYMGTFHSIFSRILRAEAQHIGFTNNFTIYDESDSRSLIKTIVKEMGLDEKVYKPASVHSRISMAKNNLMSAENYARDKDLYQADQRAKMPRVGDIFITYVQRCQQANAMDFDDLLTLTFKLFQEHEDIRKKYADRFDFLLVDEYQDTNHAQMRIVMQLCKEKERVCAVGDDSQSIYSFRGANIDNILSFQSRFKEAKLFKLEQNYRSTQSIVEAANSLIKHNSNQIPKHVYSKNDKGESLIYKPAYSDKEEALIVCREIKRIKRQDDCQYSDFAILYRTNAQSRSFEEEFRKQGIPYRIYGGLSFFQRKEIKDVIAYFRLVANPDDEEAFKRIINYPARGIGNTTVAKIATCALDNHVSFWQIISSPEHYGLGVNKGTLAKLESFRLMISGFVEKSASMNAFDLGDTIVKESGISADIYKSGSRDPEDLARQENLEELLGGMQSFVEECREEGREQEAYLTDYLQGVALLTDLDSKGDDDEPRVSLMTVHASKGLEFPTVFVVGLEENIFPSAIVSTLRELEEERRLLYVAITRAEKHCVLTSAKNRFRYGKMEFGNPSRFIKEIDSAFIQEDSEMPHDDNGFGSSGYGRGGYGNGGYGGRMPWDNHSISSQFKPDRKDYSDGEDDFRTNGRGGYRTSSRDDFRSSGRDDFRSSSRDDFRTSGRSGSGLDSRFKSVRGLEAARRIMDSSSSSLGSSSSSSGSAFGSSTSSAGSGRLVEGAKIEHQRFGVGTVLKLEGSGENAKATVQFVNSGTKQLLLKFAKFTIIG
ncbi:UvrD-helicase domain-containing protein [Prevotella copri]|uniref:ATP-dependent helicase n=1 Tax=Segatella copri TaxID=165179 RepID=UPI001C391A8D|nr:UvrD-helicase domain-containing protein [Segatella copri]MBV3414207.1 UvrD-helicase domain-containing protein [Segatella copri]